jgi:hypothetical protein
MFCLENNVNELTALKRKLADLEQRSQVLQLKMSFTGDSDLFRLSVLLTTQNPGESNLDVAVRALA